MLILPGEMGLPREGKILSYCNFFCYKHGIPAEFSYSGLIPKRKLIPSRWCIAYCFSLTTFEALQPPDLLIITIENTPSGKIEISSLIFLCLYDLNPDPE
jgi:hypothetical protein